VSRIANPSEPYKTSYTEIPNILHSCGIKSSWLKSDLHIGDEITITFSDIDESKVSKPISVRNFNDVEAERQLMLDSYRELKQELLKEGLLKE